MKKLITFSLWGDKEIFWYGAKKNIELSKIYYPDFICRFYIDKECSEERITDLRSYDGVEVILMENTLTFDKSFENRTSYEGMFWRFWAVDDKDVEIVLSRDCDSRISKREAEAVNEWLKSDKKFHIMRDHPHHLTPIMGGMWGCNTKLFRDLNFDFEKFSKLYLKNKTNSLVGKDQDFLAEIVYRLIAKDSLQHSEFGISYGIPTKNFPTERQDFEFVGDSFDENDLRNPNYWKILTNINYI